jgi:hypothetical protein
VPQSSGMKNEENMQYVPYSRRATPAKARFATRICCQGNGLGSAFSRSFSKLKLCGEMKLEIWDNVPRFFLNDAELVFLGIASLVSSTKGDWLMGR